MSTSWRDRFKQSSQAEKLEILEEIQVESRGARAMRSLLECALKDAISVVRVAGVELLATWDEEDEEWVVERLVQSLADEDSEVRMRAAEALGEREGDKSTQALIKLLQEEDDSLVLIAALESLGDLRPPEALDHVERHVANEDPLVRGYAAKSLAKIGGRSCEGRLHAALAYAHCEFDLLMVRAALYRIGSEIHVDQICSFLESSDYTVRCAAANILAEIVRPEHTQEVRASLSDALSAESTIAAESSLTEALDRLAPGDRQTGPH